jgi:fatty-acid desaturase
MDNRVVGSSRQDGRGGLPFRRIKTRYAVPIAAIHLVACLAFVPWFFSWTGLILMVIGVYAFGMLGITVGYHRLLAQ